MSAFVGLVNGLVVVKLGINSFIATLATSQILAAIALKISNNQQVLGVRSRKDHGAGSGADPRRTQRPFAPTRLGARGLVRPAVDQGRQAPLRLRIQPRSSAALGGAHRADRDRVVRRWPARSPGVAGVVFVAQVGTFSNAIGMPFLFPAYAAVFLGATQFNLRPNVWGTLLAIFTLALGVQGLQLSSSGSGFWITPLFNGIALVAAVMLSRRQSVRRSEIVEPIPGAASGAGRRGGQRLGGQAGLGSRRPLAGPAASEERPVASTPGRHLNPQHLGPLEKEAAWRTSSQASTAGSSRSP